jgi:UDP-GlcNAc:undecaprenyl-phosphate GlcNAc-1-phosphate transferase
VVVQAATAFALAFGLVPVARRVALARGLVAEPAPDRIHQIPTPYLGGVAIAAAVLAAAATARGWGLDGVVPLAGAAVVGAVGLLDDARSVTVTGRLATEVLAAVAAFAAGTRVELVNDPVDLALTVVWLVVITNAFNLLDNMDGAAAAVAATVGAALAVSCVLQGHWLLGTLAAAAAGACLGFLVHNWHPASIFMGDAGSLFLGFLLASTALGMPTRVDPAASMVAAVLVVCLPVFDTTLVVISRMRARRSIFVGATDHTAHRLLRAGFGQHAVVVLLTGATAVTAGVGAAVALDVVPRWPAAAVGVVAGVALVAMLRLPDHHQPPPEPARPAEVGG